MHVFLVAHATRSLRRATHAVTVFMLSAAFGIEHAPERLQDVQLPITGPHHTCQQPHTPHLTG